MYLFRDCSGAINHSRIRMGLSGLNFHRRRVGFISDSKCGHCTARSENPGHFFLDCPAYAAQRADLLHNLRAINNLDCPCDRDLTVKRHREKLLDLIINGTKNPVIDNILFNHVHKYIIDTKRFV